MPLLVVAGVGALIAALPAAGFAAFGRRVPAASWWIGPAVVVVLGDLIALWRLETMRQVFSELGDAPAALAELGYGHGLAPALAGWISGGLACLLIALLATGTHLLATRGGRWTPARVVVPLGLALGLPAAGLALTTASGLDLAVAASPLAAAAGCLCLALASLRDHEDPEVRPRIAAVRLALAGCVVGAAILATQVGTALVALQATGSTWSIPGSDLVLDPARRARVIGGLGVLGATVGGLWLAGPHLRFALPTRSRAGVFLAGALVAALLGAEIAVRSSAAAVHEARPAPVVGAPADPGPATEQEGAPARPDQPMK